MTFDLMIQGQEPGSDSMPDSVVTTTEEEVHTYQSEVDSNPRVRQELETVDVLFLGGLAVVGVAGIVWSSRTRRRADSAK